MASEHSYNGGPFFIIFIRGPTKRERETDSYVVDSFPAIEQRKAAADQRCTNKQEDLSKVSTEKRESAVVCRSAEPTPANGKPLSSGFFLPKSSCISNGWGLALDCRFLLFNTGLAETAI